MRPLLASLIALALLPAASAPAQDPLPAASSEGAELITNIRTDTDTSGARLVGDHFYVTTTRGLTIYDVAAPESPKKLGSYTWPEPGQPTFSQEDPDTNGKILVASTGDVLYVLDVSKPEAPALIGELADAGQHTWTCVLDCTWAYGSYGQIVDLRDPTKPKHAGDWAELHPVSSSHDVTEVAPGLILTASNPIMLLDARTEPAKPAARFKSPVGDDAFVHAAQWPHGMADKLVLTGGEDIGPGCSEGTSSYFATWRAGDSGLTKLGEFRMQTGMLADGRSPETTWCTHWFDEHPTYRSGGLVAIAWYEHGTRFLKVGADGKIEEVGHFLPLGTQASAVYWVTDTVAYIADYLRGIDVVRFTGTVPPPGEAAPAPVTATPPTRGTTPPAGSGTPPPAPRFAALVTSSCRKGRLRVRARSTRVKSLTAHAGKRRIGAGARSLAARARRGARVRITATLTDGTRLARILRGCR